VTQPRTSTRPLAPLKGGPHGAVTLAGLLRTTRPSALALRSEKGTRLRDRLPLAGLAAYRAAKWFELSDETLFALGGIVSGHTLKHLVVACAIGCVVAMLRARARRTARLPAPSRAASSGR
jgi:hypothetical protein